MKIKPQPIKEWLKEQEHEHAKKTKKERKNTMSNDQEYLKRREDELMSELVDIKRKQKELGGNTEESSSLPGASGLAPAPQPQNRNLIIMIETDEKQSISLPANFKALPQTTQRIIMREQSRLTESFCENLRKHFTEDSKNLGSYFKKGDAEKKPCFSCRGSILEFFTPTPDPQMVTAGLELITKKWRWNKAKCFGSQAFCQMVVKTASAKATRLEILNPPQEKEEDDGGGEDSGRLVSNKMTKTKGMRN